MHVRDLHRQSQMGLLDLYLWFKKKNLLLEIISQRPCTPSRINFIIAMEASPRPPLPLA